MTDSRVRHCQQACGYLAEKCGQDADRRSGSWRLRPLCHVVSMGSTCDTERHQAINSCSRPSPAGRRHAPTTTPSRTGTLNRTNNTSVIQVLGAHSKRHTNYVCVIRRGSGSVGDNDAAEGGVHGAQGSVPRAHVVDQRSVGLTCPVPAPPMEMIKDLHRCEGRDAMIRVSLLLERV